MIDFNGWKNWHQDGLKTAIVIVLGSFFMTLICAAGFAATSPIAKLFFKGGL
jgi:hypothetical protein